MYSTVGLLKHSKHSGKLIGTHQKLDRLARQYFSTIVKNSKKPTSVTFPSYKEIVYFEGMRGPDGLKRKSPGTDEPLHFIIPDHDDGKLIKIILNHQYNLRAALKKAQKTEDYTRAAFEAAWLAHAIADGLTPAHHFPYEEAVKELMTEKEYITIFGQPVKGIMRGNTLRESVKNNWSYWGVEGLMTKHVAFEYHVALIAARTSRKKLMPHLSRSELRRLKDYHSLDLKTEFYAALGRISHLQMYDHYRDEGWTSELSAQTARILLPEVIRLITISWLTALPEEKNG